MISPKLVLAPRANHKASSLRQTPTCGGTRTETSLPLSVAHSSLQHREASGHGAPVIRRQRLNCFKCRTADNSRRCIDSAEKPSAYSRVQAHHGWGPGCIRSRADSANDPTCAQHQQFKNNLSPHNRLSLLHRQNILSDHWKSITVGLRRHVFREFDNVSRCCFSACTTLIRLRSLAVQSPEEHESWTRSGRLHHSSSAGNSMRFTNARILQR